MNTLDQRESLLLRFCWLAPDRLPTRLDLRRCGWELDGASVPPPGAVGLADGGDLDSAKGLHLLADYPADVRRWIVVTGVKRAEHRSTLLQTGFGDVLPDAINIEELSARARRVAQQTNWLPRVRRVGDLELDLLARDAYRAGRSLNLNPREFALLWRLAESPNRAVAKQTLLQDVWRLGFTPKTNSVAVHISRLRSKLGYAGLEGAIQSASAGGYHLRVTECAPQSIAPPPQFRIA